MVAALGVSKTTAGLDELTFAFRSHSPQWSWPRLFILLAPPKQTLSGLVNDSTFCVQIGASAPNPKINRTPLSANPASAVSQRPPRQAHALALRLMVARPLVDRRRSSLIPPLISAYFEMMWGRNTTQNQLLPNRPAGVDIHATPCKPQGSRCSKEHRSICLRARQDGSSNLLCIGLAPAFVFRQQRTGE